MAEEVREYMGYDEVGHALVRFLREVNTIDTHIGDIRPQSNGDALVVSGMLTTTDGECDLLSSTTNTTIEKGEKFDRFKGKSAFIILSEYIERNGCSDGDVLKARLKNIDSNRCLLMPIRPGTDILLSGGKENNKTVVNAIRWVHNGSKLACEVITEEVDNKTSKKIKVPLETYGENIISYDVERQIGKKKMIQMTRFGAIKPVKITIGKNEYVIDNQYMYRVSGELVKIIAYWDNYVMKPYGDDYLSIMQGKSKDMLLKHMDHIGKHRRYIAPFGLLGCVSVEMEAM